MSRVYPMVLDRLSKKPTSPALRQISEMANDSAVETLGHAAVQPAHEVLSVWSIRLWNATLKARRYVGLADLVRTLLTLSPDQNVEQIALRSGPKTGLVFFIAGTDKPIGAVISVRNESDARRSLENLEEAKGIATPVFSARSAAR